MKKEVTEIERIGSCMIRAGINVNLNANNLCLEIQDKIRKLNNDYNKTKFMLKVYKSKDNVQANTRAISENEIVNTYKNENLRLKKINNELMETIDGLRLEVERYKKSKINNIVYSNDSRELALQEYLL